MPGENEKAEETEKLDLPFEMDEQGRFLAVLPCGKRPVIQPIHPSKFRRIGEAFPRPEPPEKVLEIPGRGIGQKIRSETDPDYLRELEAWYTRLHVGFLIRCVVDGLVVPEEADYDGDDGSPRIAMPDCPLHKHLGKRERWLRMGFKAADLVDTKPASGCTCLPCEEDWGFTLRCMSVPVPQEAPDRNWAYLEEALPKVLEDIENQHAFVRAVRAISLPTEEAIRQARRNFRHAMARLGTAKPETAEG
jgi:hypothetical protein